MLLIKAQLLKLIILSLNLHVHKNKIVAYVLEIER